MLSALVRFSLQRRGLILALAVLLVLYGSVGLWQAGLDIFPEFSAPRVIIQTEAPGLTTEQTETRVTLPIERHLAGLMGLEHLRSESIPGLSVVTAVFTAGDSIHTHRLTVGERLSALAGELPGGVATPVLVPLSSSSATVLTLGLRSNQLDLMDLRDWVDWTLAPRLLAIPGVADVNVFGGLVRQMQIQPDPSLLLRYGLSLNDVVRAALGATPLTGSGFIETGNQRIGVRVSGLPQQVSALESTVLIQENGKHLTLGDVASVREGPKPPIGAAAINAETGIVLMVIGQYGSNTLSLSREVEQVLTRFQSQIERQGIQLYPHLFRPADYIQRSIGQLGGHLLIGGGLVILVLGVFLYDYRTAFISSLAIPLSLLAAVIVLLATGTHLNIMILGGLAIALGEVVDDAIIDTENIDRRLRENRLRERPLSEFRVVLRASLEVRSSVIYASFIVALVFLPLLTLGGVAGRLFAPLGWAYILSILMSLMVALTVIPALCYTLLRHKTTKQTPPLIAWLRPRYHAILGWLIPHPGKTVLASLLLLGLTLGFLPNLGGEFLPQLREGHFIVHTSSLPGTSLEESLRIGGLITREIQKLEEVESVSQWAGRAERGADTYGSHYSEYEVRLKPRSGQEQQNVLDRIRQILLAVPGIRYEVNTFLTERVDETLSGYTAPVVVNLYGSDLDKLDGLARQLTERMSQLPGAIEVQLRSPPNNPLLDVRLNPEKLAYYGLRSGDVTDALHTAVQGRLTGNYQRNDRAYPIAVILPPFARRMDKIGEIPLKTPDGQAITLNQVAEVQQVEGRYNILHRSGQRVQTVTAQVSGRDMATFAQRLEHLISQEMEFPAEVYPELTGAAVEQGKARSRLVLHASLAGAGVLLLIYLALGSVRLTALTLMNLPFALIGGVLAALWTGGLLSVGTTVGFITLFGITVRNAIMLMSHYRHLVGVEKRKWNRATAMEGAGERLPSILMTALVTALAMLPIALDSDNPGLEIMGPMATIIMGGLVSSTVLNLLLLPTLLLRFGGLEHFSGE
ncbi:MAG: efflux RND transporter permease subunit [Methylococcaceae bacterium]